MTHSHDTSTPAMSAETVPSEEFVRKTLEKIIAADRTGPTLYEKRWDGIEQAIGNADGECAAIARAALATLSASHLAKEGGEAGAVEPIEKHRIANRLRGMFDMSFKSGDPFNHLSPDGFRLLRQAHDALIAPDEAVAAPVLNPSPAAKGGDAVRQAIGSPEWCDEAERSEWAFMAKMLGEAIDYIRPANLSGLGVAKDVAEARAKEGWRTHAALSTPTEGPASQTESMGGEVKAKAKHALYSLRFEGQPMSSMFSAEELGLIVDTVSAALTPPETAEAVPDDLTAAYMAGVERGREEAARLREDLEREIKASVSISETLIETRRLYRVEKLRADDAVKALEEARAATASDPAPATDDRGRLVEALREARQWVEANTAQVRGLSLEAAAPGETMLRKIDDALATEASR